jgi:hypothetical protein
MLLRRIAFGRRLEAFVARFVTRFVSRLALALAMTLFPFTVAVSRRRSSAKSSIDSIAFQC